MSPHWSLLRGRRKGQIVCLLEPTTALTLQTFKHALTTSSILLILAIMKKEGIEKSGHAASSVYL